MSFKSPAFILRPLVLFIFLLSLLLCVHVQGYCQVQHLKFNHLTTDDGLSQSTVLGILQDRKGFMWFATRDGLNKYDGYSFTVYKNILNDTSSLSSNIIRDIMEDKDGNLWIATWGGGVNKFDRRKQKFIRYQHDPNNANSLSGNFINSLHQDSEGNILIGTRDQGLDVLNPEAEVPIFRHFPHDRHQPYSLSGMDVRAIFEDSQQNIWVGTASEGLNLFDKKKGTFKRIQHNEADPHSLSNDHIRFIFEDSRQRLWVGTYGGGLNQFDRKTRHFRHYKKDPQNNNSLSHNFLVSIAEDASGNLWLGTENHGLSIFNPSSNTFNHYAYNEVDKTSLSSNSVNSLYRDEKGNMWLGTFTGGINQFNVDANKFIHHKKTASPNSLSHNSVLSFFEDSRGNFWIGTDGGGLNLYDRQSGSFTSFLYQENNKQSISGNHVLSISEGTEGNIWVGTWKDGITVFNKQENSYRHYKHEARNKASLSSNNAWSILKDTKGNIWIGTYGGGLNLYDPASDGFIHFKHEPHNPKSISNNSINSIFEDSRGYLWIGTEGGGLNLFDPSTKEFVRYEHKKSVNSISNNVVKGIYEDGQGNMWIATNAGLNFLDVKTKQFTAFHTTDGLPNDVIMGILEDEKGNLWISTNHGLSKFNPQARSFKNYTVADGLQAKEFKEKAFFKSRTGKMYFGGINGFNEFFPDSVKDKPYTPPLLLTSFQIFNKTIEISENPEKGGILSKNISETKEISIPYKYSVISFEYASLNYTASEKKKYAYKLTGFDEGWNEVGSRRSATYTNLDPGNYTFEVKGLNSEGEWASETARVALTIVPPFYKTWWFRLGVLAILAGSFVCFYKIRTRMIVRKKKELEKLVIERTVEIRQKSAEIERINALLKAQNQELELNVEDATKARVLKKELTFSEFKQIFPDDEACFQYLAQLKWVGAFACRKCGNTSHSPWKTPFSRRCTRCNYIESPTAYTFFHGLKFSVLKAFYMLFLVHENQGITADELSQIVGVSGKSCKVFKKKILDLISEKKSTKKNMSWDDLIIPGDRKRKVA